MTFRINESRKDAERRQSNSLVEILFVKCGCLSYASLGDGTMCNPEVCLTIRNRFQTGNKSSYFLSLLQKYKL